MKLIFQKESLMNGINIVSKAIPSKTTMNILECILIDASAEEIKLTGNDMELGIETKVKGSISERGRIALEAKIFSDIIRKLPDSDSDVAIISDESFHTTIECDHAVFKIQGRDPQEYSYLPFIEKDQHICLSQFSLKEAIRQTIFSISPNDSNKMMGGELLEIKDNILKLVSLDGHRISIRNILLKYNYDSKKVIIPGKTLSEISKILTGDNEKTAQNIAKKLKIDKVISNVMPKQKAEEIEKLKQNGLVMMCGDGINDSISLVKADIGVSVSSGTDIARDSAQVVIMNDNLNRINDVIDISKKTVRNIKQNLFWAFFYNVCMIPVACGFLVKFGIMINPMIASLAMTLSSLFVVLNVLKLKVFYK